MKTIRDILYTTLLTVGLSAYPLLSSAQENSTEGTSFQGKVSNVDKSSQTITINNQSYQALPTTRFMSDNDQSADFSDIKAGQQISGRYKMSAENKRELLEVGVAEAVGGTSDSDSESGESLNGKISKVDQSDKTVTISGQTIQVLPTTQITRKGQAATFKDIQVGRQVDVNYKMSSENKMEALSLDIGSSAVGGTKNDATSESGASFSGKISKVDTAGQTFTIGQRTYHILPTTQITSHTGDSASLNTLKTGQQVSGTYKKSAESKMEVLSLQVGNNPKR